MFGMPRVNLRKEASVSPMMADRYARIMMDLRTFASERGLPDPLHDQRSQALDVTLRAYVSKLFWDGRCFHEASAALAAVGFRHASLSRHAGKPWRAFAVGSRSGAGCPSRRRSRRRQQIG